MITVGVDLAAEPKGTAVAIVKWTSAGAVVRELVVGADDATVCSAAAGADKVGIDCPFGWPVPFLDFLAEHRTGHVVLPDDLDGRDWRRTLALRTTDLAVWKQVGLRPLTVAADRIAYPAMRCAGLLSKLARQGYSVDRAGSGLVVEVYPAASLKQWALPHRRYKGDRNTTALNDLVDALMNAAPWLDLADHGNACRRSDHAFDAVIAAFTARAAVMGATTSAPPDHAETTRIEGWIAVPATPLSTLAGER